MSSSERGNNQHLEEMDDVSDASIEGSVESESSLTDTMYFSSDEDDTRDEFLALLDFVISALEMGSGALNRQYMIRWLQRLKQMYQTE